MALPTRWSGNPWLHCRISRGTAGLYPLEARAPLPHRQLRQWKLPSVQTPSLVWTEEGLEGLLCPVSRGEKGEGRETSAGSQVQTQDHPRGWFHGGAQRGSGSEGFGFAPTANVERDEPGVFFFKSVILESFADTGKQQRPCREFPLPHPAFPCWSHCTCPRHTRH